MIRKCGQTKTMVSIAVLEQTMDGIETKHEAEQPLLHLVAVGDTKAVSQCIEKYGALIWSMAKKACVTQDVEDATQEVFIAIWQNAGKFNPEIASEKTYIAMIARRRLIDRARKHARRIDATTSELQEFACLEDSDPAVDVADEVQKARDCLSKLNETPRKVLLLSIYEGLSHSGISDSLKLPLGTIKSYARRSLLTLRDCMERGSYSSTPGGKS